jgi:hypothetical protein
MVMSPVGFGTKNYCAGECQQQLSGLYWAVYPPIVATQRLGKHLSAATMNYRICRFLRGLCHVKAKLSFSSSQNFLFHHHNTFPYKLRI